MARTRIILALLAVTCLVGGITLVAYARMAQPDKDVLQGSDLRLTGEMRDWIDSLRAEPGAYVKTFGNYRLVLVARGLVPTAGYQVSIDDVSFLDVHPPAGGPNGPAAPASKWCVSVKFVDPEPGQMLAQVISYPYAVVAVRDNGGEIEVNEVSGEEPVELPVTIER